MSPRAQILHWAERGHLPSKDINAALELAQVFPNQDRWRKFLSLLMLATGTLLAGCSLASAPGSATSTPPPPPPPSSSSPPRSTSGPPSPSASPPRLSALSSSPSPKFPAPTDTVRPSPCSSSTLSPSSDVITIPFLATSADSWPASLIALVLIPAHGVAAALVLILIGFGRAAPVLTGLGIAAGLVYLSNYYYARSLTLLHKSLVLMASGLLLLALRWTLFRKDPA